MQARAAENCTTARHNITEYHGMASALVASGNALILMLHSLK